MKNMRLGISAFCLALGLGAVGVGSVPANAANADLLRVNVTAPCQDVVVLGAEGSGQDYLNNSGFGPEAEWGLISYASHMGGYTVGYFPVPYPSAGVETLATPSKRKLFFSSIDEGVSITLAFLANRTSRCHDERYVFMGYSQGAMVMHRVLWQLAGPQYRKLGTTVLPRLDGILAIADGDKVPNQGGVSSGTAPANGHGIWWEGARAGATKATYMPLNQPITNIPGWPASRFFSVCRAGDIVCDYGNGSNNFVAGMNIHGNTYKPNGEHAAYVASAASSIARISRQLHPLPSPLPAIPVRVGQVGTAVLAPDGGQVASVSWVSAPIPGSVLSPGFPTIPATLVWTPQNPGVADYTVRVTSTSGTTTDVSGAFEAFPVPAPSLAVTNVQTSYDPTTTAYGYPASMVTFDITKTAPSDASPLKSLNSKEDLATDFFSYVSGDTNSNGVLDPGETWSYSGHAIWGEWEPANARTRTVVVKANDKTGAGAWTELEAPMALTR